ncbi:MAG: hypothetical protein M3323_01015 [Actinomycetota bacterium]|nr:hypothetical protein [Actinomycetota bacterium]
MTSVLFVDDHNELTRLLVNELTGRGYVVDRAQDPDALASLGRSGWDIAFVDMFYDSRLGEPDSPHNLIGAPAAPGDPGPTRKTGIDALEWLASNSPETRLVLFTTPGDGRSIFITDAFRRFRLSGAVSKTVEGAVARALNEVLAGRTYVDDPLRPYEPADGLFPLDALFSNPLHREVLRELLRGRTRWSDIAETLDIKEDAVQARIRKMGERLVEAGYVDPDKPMNKGDWIALVTTYRTFFEDATARADRIGEPAQETRKIGRRRARRRQQ